MIAGGLLLGLSALLLLAAAHPLAIYPWTLRFAPRRRVPAAPAAPTPPTRPTLAVCLCAYREEAVIGWKAQSLLDMAQAYGGARVLVHVDGTGDRTLERLAPFADRITVIHTPGRCGKTAGMAKLLAASQSELLAFTDANVETPVDGLVRLAARFADPEVACATAVLTYTNPGETAMSGSGSLYWSVEERIKARESDTIGVVGVDGAFFMMRRADYEPPPSDIIDDLYVSLTVLAAGRAVVSARDVEVSERGATAAGEEFRRKARISCQAWNVHRLAWPRLRRMSGWRLYGYLSHRVMKWLIPWSLLASGLSGASGLALLVGPAPVAGLALLLGLSAWAGDRLGIRPVRAAIVALVSLAGVAVGGYESLLLGKRYVTWEIAQSVRS